VFGVVESGRLLAAVGLFATDEGFFGVEERELIETLQADVSFALDRLALDSRRLDAEEALSQSENARRLLFEDNPLPMWIYEAETLEFLAVNDAAVAKYGYSRDEFLHLTIKDVRPETDIGPLVDHVAHKNQGFQDSGYWTHRDASGREFPVHIITHTTEWAGRLAQLVLVQEVAQVH
jgi:PAS domain S-box-containing protein